MAYDLNYFAEHRYTAKAYNPARRIPENLMDKVRELIRLAPSSVNAQPWHVLIADTDAARARIAKATQDVYVFNEKAVLDASHVLVFCARTGMDAAFLNHVTEQEVLDGRYDAVPEARDKVHGARARFITRLQEEHSYQFWADRQVYINIGQLLIGVATLGIDATPMEGFDNAVLDQELDLRAKGLHSLMLLPMGYHDEAADHNAARPKSRLPYADIISTL